jgi:hypothetical protein
MLTILNRSASECFICSKAEHCVEVRIKTPNKFVGTMCMSCLYKRIPEKEVENVEAKDSS